jgi:DNA-binding Lrp family transcriptional regulator
MARQLIQHMVKKPNTGFIIIAASAIQVEGNCDLSFGRGAGNLGCAHELFFLWFAHLIDRAQGQAKPLAQNAALCQLTGNKMRPIMSTCVFIQIRCKPGKTYQVADQILLRELHSELYSTSGDYDMILKMYIPSDQDVGKYINDNLLDIEHIERSLTTLTFNAF